MEENEIAIPFEVEKLHENLVHKIARKTAEIAKAFIRRIIDIFFAIIGIILLVPLSVVVFFQNLKNGDNGKIFYVQERIGKNGKIFKMFKFRTMVNNADEILEDMLKDEKIKEEYETYRKFKMDPRLTTFGKFLRNTTLDEFPQFINILKGDMSLVGPRPYLPEEKERMGDYYKYIIQHKPGLTGVYQIAAIRNMKFEDRLDMDYRYHYRRTFKLDIKIALITILVTLKRRKTFESIGKISNDTASYIYEIIRLFIKRIIDIIGALCGIIMLVPLTAIVFVGNKICKDNGPIFFSQERIGKDGKTFKMYKFRSMVLDADNILFELLAKDEGAREEYTKYKKLKNDPRVTKMGKFLRKTSLDEFPQFINVLKGDMSLVGPRAYLPREKEDMGRAYETIINVKPGVTGYWQVAGRSNVCFDERLDMDLEYIENINLLTDMGLLVKTVEKVVKREGAD